MRTLSTYWNKLSLLTRSMWILFLLNGVLASYLMFLLTGYLENTTLGYTGKYVSAHAGSDSWMPMIKSLEHLQKNPEVPVYKKIFFDEHIKFQYPTSSLLIIELIQAIPGMSSLKAIKLLNGLSWLSVLFIGILTSMLLYNSSSVTLGRRFHVTSKTDTLALYSVILLITLTFYPITRSFVLGQIQTVLTLMGAASLLAWQYGRKKTAGLLIGLTCTVSPQWGLILLWGWLRRQWGMAIVGTIMAAGFIGISIYMYGLHHYVDYMSVLSFLSQHGEAFFPNQSVNGLVNRFLFNGNNLHWAADSFPPYNPIVYGSTLISTFLIIGTAFLWRWRDTAGVSVTQLAIIMLSVTIASPIAWEHHYGILLPIYAVIVPLLLSERVFGKWTIAYLISAFFLSSQRLDVTNYFADTRLNVLQSYLFFAGIMMLLALYRVSHNTMKSDYPLSAFPPYR